jgi:hypothetical protein
MKATIKIRNLEIEVEGETQKDLFREIASATEVFGEAKCGACGCERITPHWRTVTQGKKVYEYPEYHCRNPECRARLSLGSSMEGGSLFPQRKLDAQGRPDRENGSYGKHQGWTVYRGEKKV